MSPEALEDHERYGKPSDVWSLGAVISFYCNGVHLFRTPREVKVWPGGKSTLERNKYSIELRQLTADMLFPKSNFRPTASKIVAETLKDNGQKM